MWAQSTGVIPGGDASGNFPGGRLQVELGNPAVGTSRKGTTPDSSGMEKLGDVGWTSRYAGFGVTGDSNTVCYQFATVDARHCAFLEASRAETGSTITVDKGYGGTNILDYTWFEEMYNKINPTVTGNPIRHLMIGTNTVRLLKPNTQPPAAWLTAASQEMYEMAIHQTTGPQDKFLPDDPAYATALGTWTRTFNFVSVTGPVVNGCGYAPGDTLQVDGTPFVMTVDTVVNSPCEGTIDYSHVSTFATPPYRALVQPTATTALTGSGSGATYEPFYLNNVNYTLISPQASTDTIEFSNIPVERGCVFLNYEVWPAVGLPGGAAAASLSVYADGSEAPMTDVLTGLATISGQISDSEPGTGQNRNLGGYNGWKVAKLCGLPSGVHQFILRKNSTGIAGIQYLASPDVRIGEAINGPYLNVIGILPIYPAGSSGYDAAIAAYDELYMEIVYDLAIHFGRRIVFTDTSEVDMSRDYYVAIGNQYWGKVLSCGIQKGTLTMTETYPSQEDRELPSTGQVIEASNLENCRVANGVLLVVQSVSGTLASATITARAESPSTTGAVLSGSDVPVGSESATAVTEITMDGWIPNASSGTTVGDELHMPQNAQMDLARRVEITDRNLPRFPIPKSKFLSGIGFDVSTEKTKE
jgi:hypothetical protein